MTDYINPTLPMEEAEEEEESTVVEDTSTENIPASEGGETVTPEEVARTLNLPSPSESEESEDDESEDEDSEADEESEDAESDDNADDQADESEDETDSSASDESADENERDDSSADTAADSKEFELKVEDANGKEFTLKPGDNLEKALEDFEPKSNGQIMQVLNDFQRLEAEKSKFDEEKATSDARAEFDANIKKINEGWQSEIKELQGQKRIPVQSDGKQPERVDEVFKFMADENEKREKNDRPLIRSFEDALDKLELRERKEAEAQKEKEEKETARKKGSIVGGSSAPASSSQPVYKGGARNAVEAARQMGVLK